VSLSKSRRIPSDDSPLGWLKDSVDDQHVPFMDPSPDHRVAIDPNKEGCRRMLDEMIIKIEVLLQIVFGGGGKAGLNGDRKEGDFHPFTITGR